MTDKELEEKEIEVINEYLGNEARKLSTGQVLKEIKPSIKDNKGEWGPYGTGRDVKTVLEEVSDEYEDLYEIGKKLREAIEPYRYMLEEGNVVEYLQIVGSILFGKPNTDASRSEAK